MHLPVSPVYLPYISPTSRLYLAQVREPGHRETFDFQFFDTVRVRVRVRIRVRVRARVSARVGVRVRARVRVRVRARARNYFYPYERI